jgi:predicted dehydrogenase
MAENGSRRIRLGMVGGGSGAFIGFVHRIASRIDGDYELVAGALSSNADNARQSARNLGIVPERAYASYEEMARAEAARPDGIEAVAIVTPNKPLTSTLADARALRDVKPKNGARFLLTHNYTGYPLVRQARELVRSGALGAIRVVQAEYAQDWLTEPVSNKQADWRTDPQRSGAGGAIGDIGTHAYNLLRFVTGLTTEAVSADLQSFVPGRKVDDNVHIMLRFESGARGMLWASQVAPGNENALKLRVYGDKAGLEWRQENPNEMWFTELGKPKQLLTRGGAISGNAASAMNVRVPAGHPEGYLEGFATLYAQFAAVIRGEAGEDVAGLLPSLADGVEGVEFITASIQSSRNDGKWTRLAEV